MRLSQKYAFYALLIGFMLIQQMLLFGPVLAERGPSPPSSPLKFIYIDANVGGSSGGHSALRIHNTVYHFQYFPDGLFKLVRDQWPYFRYIYNDLENRTLHVAHIQIENRDLQLLKEYLDRYYLIQKAHMARLDERSADTELLKDLSRDHFRMSVNGAGLFSLDAPSNKAGTLLKSAVINTYGEDYLKRAMETLDHGLSKIPVVASEVTPHKIARDVYPPAMTGFSKKYAENRLKHTALNVLNGALPVQKLELTDMDHFLRPGDRQGLTRNERKKLSAYAETLKSSVIHLATSSRPDWGYPLLLANARYQAVMCSLEQNRLFLLDPFPGSAKSVAPKTLAGDPTVTEKLADRAWKKYWDIRRDVFAGPSLDKRALDKRALDERAYNRLEEGAGRFAELEKGRLTGNALRVAYGRLIPSRSGAVPLPAPELSQSVDGGDLSLAGLKGTLYSLPELFFFNIRKGSYNYVDDPADSETGAMERSAPAFDRYVYP